MHVQAHTHIHAQTYSMCYKENSPKLKYFSKSFLQLSSQSQLTLMFMCNSNKHPCILHDRLEDHEPQSQNSEFQIPALLLISYVTLGKLLTLSASVFPSEKDNNSAYLLGIVGKLSE